MKKLLPLFAGLLILLLLGSGSPKEYDDRTAQEDYLEGSWEQSGGGGPDKLSFLILLNHSPKGLSFFRGRVLASDGLAVMKGTYRADFSKRPPTLDLTYTEGPQMGQTLKYLYVPEADSLDIYLNTDQTNRPASLRASTYNLHYRRLKK